MSQTLIFRIVLQLVFLLPQHTFDRPFQKVNFPQYKGNVQLLFNFIEALFPLFHFLPVLAPIEKFAYLVGDKSNVGQKIEILKRDLDAIGVEVEKKRNRAISRGIMKQTGTYGRAGPPDRRKRSTGRYVTKRYGKTEI